MADIAEKPLEEVTSTETEQKEDEVVAEKPAEKTDDSVAAGSEPTKEERAIIRQVEYYFGDANLNRDKFLLEQIGKDDGWVPLSVLLTFKRLSGLSTDTEVIVSSLEKSDEGLLEISEDRQKLRRHPERPIPEHNEERRKEIMSRTAYAKGFPLDADMTQILEFFAPYEKVVNINMRKYLDKPTKLYKFKGSVFVTFEKVEQTKDFVEKEKVLYNDRILLRKWQDKYLEDKREEIKAKNDKKKAKVQEEEKVKLPKGTVLFFEGTTEDVTREMLREAVDKIDGEWDVAYVDFSKGDKDGYVRFQTEDIAAKFAEKLTENKLKVKEDLELPVRVLVDEEETTYLAKAVEQMKQRRSHNNRNKGGHHGHGHHHGNRKRRGGNDNRHDHKKKKAAAAGDD